ncbi:MAG TPA: signal recognition particle protein [Acidimicrobiia bacterium]|jgi:signal recognition particle subunit SRP54
MFESLTSQLNRTFDRLRGRGRLGAAEVDQALAEVRTALLEADVNVDVVTSLTSRIRERALGAEVQSSLTPGRQVIKIVNEELIDTLGREVVPLARTAPPLVIMVTGLQGSGKTTTAAKLARLLQEEGKRPALVAADLQRPAAIDQLETLGGRLGVPVFTDRGSRPARLVRTAIRDATRAGHDAIIIDTAGRLQIDRELMRELSDVAAAAEPGEILLVVDAMTGQEAVAVARGFAAEVGITGLVLTKLDGDARGGAAISVREVTGQPIKFVGVGEGLEALEPFHPERMASRILGMGDVLSLIEKAEQTFDQEEAEAAAKKMEKGSFSLEDFLQQFQMLKRMGPLKDLIAMLPGAGALGEVDIDDRALARVEAIIRSMTPEERRNPKIIGGSRKRRIANGSGSSPQDVNRLLKQFADAQQMMKSMAGGRGMPRLGKVPAGAGRPGTTRPKKSRKR